MTIRVVTVLEAQRIQPVGAMQWSHLCVMGTIILQANVASDRHLITHEEVLHEV